MHQGNDRTAKWLIDHHGDSILRMAGITGFTRWQPLPAETVAPRRLPDGLIEIWFPGENQPGVVLIEIETYPGKDVDRQVFEDLEAVHLARGVTPEVVCLVLKPKGNQTVTGTATRRSRSGSTTVTAVWPVVNLWEIDAEQLLARNDPGLIPWVPLAKSARTPDDLLVDCRDRLAAIPDQRTRKDLTAVTAILSRLANDPKRLLNLFGGHQIMIESPLIDELMEYVREKEYLKAQIATLRSAICAALEARFGSVPAELPAAVSAISDPGRLESLLRIAATCPDVAAFQSAMTTDA